MMDLNCVKCSTCGREAVTKMIGGIATFPAPCLCCGSSFSALLTGHAEPEDVVALRKDAERYRWLRDDHRGRTLSVAALDWTGDASAADAAVDAAMAAASVLGAA